MTKIKALQIIKQSFKITFRYPLVFLWTLPFGISMITALVGILILVYSINPLDVYSVLVSLVLLLLSFWLGMTSAGSVILSVERIPRKQKVKFWDILNKSFGNSWRLVIAYSLEQFFLLTGLLFFIIPGIFLAVRLSLVVPGCILEKRGYGIKRSWNATKGNFWKIFLILAVWNSAFIIVGLVPYLSIISILLLPVYLTTLTLLYMQLRKR